MIAAWKLDKKKEEKEIHSPSHEHRNSDLKSHHFSYENRIVCSEYD